MLACDRERHDASRRFIVSDSTGFYEQFPIGFEGKLACERMIV